MNRTEREVRKLWEWKHGEITDAQWSKHWTYDRESLTELLSLLDGDAEPVGWRMRHTLDGRPISQWFYVEKDPSDLPEKLQLEHEALYLHPPEPNNQHLLGYIEEREIPVMGRATIHQEPNASRVEVYVKEVDDE